MYNYRMINGDFWGGSLLMAFLSFLFFVIIVSLFISLLRGPRMGHRHGRYIGHSSPLDIAKERYVKGEITKTEFEQFKKDLSE